MLKKQQSTESNQEIDNHRRKIVIAHRGLCSIFPQNTKQAIMAGVQTADLTQFDVHLTKDEQIIVFHDRYLSRTTNIRDHLQFSQRFKQQKIDDYQEVKSDWWVRDFTLDELRKLKVHQPIKYRPNFEFISYQISSLEQIIQQVVKIKGKEIHKSLKSGLLIQIKQEIATQITQKDKILCRKFVQLLRKYNLDTFQGMQKNNLPIVIQSFNIPLLSNITGCQNMIFQLYDKDQIITEKLLEDNRIGNVKGIGITQQNLLDKQGVPEKRIGQICKKFNYSLNYWTIRDDDQNSKPFSCDNYNDVYLKLQELGITGFITQFPDKCKGYLKLQTVMYSKGNAETERTEQKDKNRKLSQCQSMDSSNQ